MQPCPRCGATLGRYRDDGGFEMKHKGRTVRVYAPAKLEIGCEDCQNFSQIVLDRAWVPALV